MRRTFGGRGKGGTGFKQKGEDEENGVYVPKKFYLARDKLAAYPDEDGCPFYLGDAEDEKSFFAPGFLLSTRSSRNEEYFHRPGMALSLGAASMHRACRTMKDRLLPCWALKGADEPVEKILDFEAKFKKTGLTGLVDLLATSDGERLLEALETLDVGREGRRDQQRVEKAVRDLVDLLGEHGQQLRKNASRAASFAAKVYLGSMSIMEHLELLEHRKDWAKNMEDAAKGNKHIKAWTKNPKDGDLLIDALTAAFMEKVKKHGKGKNQRKQAADTSSEEGDNDDSAKSDADSEHDSPRHREEKKRIAQRSALPRIPRPRTVMSQNRYGSTEEENRKEAKKESARGLMMLPKQGTASETDNGSPRLAELHNARGHLSGHSILAIGTWKT